MIHSSYPTTDWNLKLPNLNFQSEFERLPNWRLINPFIGLHIWRHFYMLIHSRLFQKIDHVLVDVNFQFLDLSKKRVFNWMWLHNLLFCQLNKCYLNLFNIQILQYNTLHYSFILQTIIVYLLIGLLLIIFTQLVMRTLFALTLQCTAILYCL